MACLKYDDKAFMMSASIDCIQEVYENVEKKLNRIKKNVRRYMWKKGIKKR